MSYFSRFEKHTHRCEITICIVKKYSFEFFIGLCLIIYTAFYFTPSSYGLVLSVLEMKGEGLYLGKPQTIRSDEWAVWTPYLQALVKSDFERYNTFSIYHEDFRNFNALPIYDWGLFFKPQFWSFLFMEPARAFSFYHGFLIAAFLLGWKRFIELMMGNHRFASQLIFIIFSFLLFFSSFVQGWWTTVGPVIAFFPWLMIVLLSWQKNSIFYYTVLFYVAVVWLLSHTYPPLIISCSYLGIILLLIYQPCIFTNTRRVVFTILALISAIIVSAYYFSEIIKVMMDTIYPGQRSSAGGAIPWWHLLLSTFFPYVNYSYDTSTFIEFNSCEAGSVSSLLALIALCFSDLKKINQQGKREIKYLFLILGFFGLWMSAPIPKEFGRYFMLTSVPPIRMMFVFGIATNLITLSILLQIGVKLTYQRIFLFSCLLLFSWIIPMAEVLPELYKESGWFNKSAMELFAIPLLVAVGVLKANLVLNEKQILTYILCMTLLVNGLYFAMFNPVQSAEPIFKASENPILNRFKVLQQQNERGWLVSSIQPGAVITGLGFKSFAHVLIQPQLDFFRNLFPHLSETEINSIFNRYAHIQVYNGNKIVSPQPDVIRIPLKLIAQ